MGDWLEGDSKTSQLVIKYLVGKTLEAAEGQAQLCTSRGLGWLGSGAGLFFLRLQIKIFTDLMG